MTECLSSGMHCPPPVFFVPPSVDPLFGTSGSTNPLSTSGRLDIHLNGGYVSAPNEGVAGWFAHNFGIFTTRQEKYTVRDFIEKYALFLEETSLRNVLFIDVDYTLLYADKKNEHPEDLSKALTKAYEYLAHHPGPTNTAILSVVGRTNKGLAVDLDLTVQAQYFRRHELEKPGIEITIVGIPSALVKGRNESKEKYETRLKQLTDGLEDVANREKFRTVHEELMKLLVADYKHHISALFEVDSATEQVYASPKASGYPKASPDSSWESLGEQPSLTSQDVRS